MEKKLVPESFLMSDGYYALIVIIIMISAGVLGGVASYYLNESEDKSKKKSITLGVVASMIVPVFLNMISSNLLIEAQKHVDKIMVFSGFCILAAVFSRNFLENIYNKVIQQVGNIGKQVKDFEEAASEPDVPTADVTEEVLKVRGLTQNEFMILNGLSAGKYTYRSISGLNKETGLERSDINSCVNTLVAKGLIETRVNDRKRMRYFLSGEGRKMLGELNAESNNNA